MVRFVPPGICPLITGFAPGWRAGRPFPIAGRRSDARTQIHLRTVRTGVHLSGIVKTLTLLRRLRPERDSDLFSFWIPAYPPYPPSDPAKNLHPVLRGQQTVRRSFLSAGLLFSKFYASSMPPSTSPLIRPAAHKLAEGAIESTDIHISVDEWAERFFCPSDWIAACHFVRH